MEGSKTHQPTQQTFRHRLIYFFQGIAFTICLLTLILTIYLIIIFHKRLTPFISYAIVFDAGSSHTEMFIYHWPADKSNGLGTTSTVDELFVCPLKTIYINDSSKSKESIKLKAISDFEHNLDRLEDYFRPCLTEAIEKIPAHRRRISPIFLGATAGMRLSQLKNFTRSNAILEKIREIFSNSPFQFVTAHQVRILTGMEEAIDGWITTNILLEKFKHRHTKRTISSAEFDPNMAGVLDLGGASTQVTFTYEKMMNNESVPAEFTQDISLFDSVYTPYAHSYLCWGKNEVLKRHRARLINSAINANRTDFSRTNRSLIRDPCIPRGANEDVSVSHIFGSPCTVNEKAKFNSYFNKTSLIFVGSGNATQCKQRLTSLFDDKQNDSTVQCSYKKEYCSFDRTFQPLIPSNIHFIGLSGYYYVFNNLAFRMRNGSHYGSERYKLNNFSSNEIIGRIHDVCETNYTILGIQENMTKETETFKRNMCFDAWYMWLLLTYGIGFQENDLKRISFANKFPTGKVGWTLGYMINQTNYIPSEYREKSLTNNQFTTYLTISIIFISITILFLLFTGYFYCRRISTIVLKNRNDYLRPNEQELA